MMVKIMLSVFFAFALVVRVAAVEDEEEYDLLDAVVKIFATSNSADFLQPWQSTGSRSGTGSGCVIEGNRIITNAHVVADSTFIQVRRESSPRRYVATVEAIAHDCDLALLRVDDPEFFAGVKPLTFGPLPQIRDAVFAVGFPLGGDKLSITEGVVSRIEVIHYVQGGRSLLGAQIDAAINPGNSGGPIILAGRMVGVAMQAMNQSQNIGYMIPAMIVEHFLADIADGRHDGFPMLGVRFQPTENPGMRRQLGLDQDSGGVLICHVLPFSATDGILFPGDVILAVDGVPVSEDGSFEMRRNERIAFSHLSSRAQVGDKLPLAILRDGREMSLDIAMAPPFDLVPPPNTIETPSYYIHGGLVFTPLSGDLLTSWGENWWLRAPGEFLHFFNGRGSGNHERRRQVVAMIDILPDEVNAGYENMQYRVVDSVNGQKFDDFRDFVRLARAPTADTLTKFQTFYGERIVIPGENIDAITASIAARNLIPKTHSDDVADIVKTEQ